MEGQCLCGSISLSTPDVTEFEACHCGMCRRWGGGPLMAFHCGQDVTVDGLEQVGVFKSSEWAERAFCKQCGSHLYYRFLPANQYIVPIGLFQDAEGLKFTEQVFVDHKPEFYAFANETSELTEKQVIEKFSQ